MTKICLLTALVLLSTIAPGQNIILRYGGHQSTVKIILDLQGGAKSSSPSDLTRFGSRIYFTVDNAGSLDGLWSIDKSLDFRQHYSGDVSLMTPTKRLLYFVSDK